MENGTASKLEIGQLAELASAIIRQLTHIEGLGEVAQGWIENGAALKKALGEALVPAEALVPIQVWKTWKTIKLGTGLKTAEDFRKALKAIGCKIGDWANDILGKSAFSAASKEAELELVRVSVKELGFKKGATRQEIYQRAQELGLKICPNEVGPQLRLQYENQPNGEWIVVAMEPISDSVGDLGLFHVERVGHDRWLFGNYGGHGYVWNADNEFVFCK